MKNNRCDHELCIDRFGRKSVFPINRPNETVIYVKRSDGSLSPRYRAATPVSDAESD
jgi:hypothetical protein